MADDGGGHDRGVDGGGDGGRHVTWGPTTVPDSLDTPDSTPSPPASPAGAPAAAPAIKISVSPPRSPRLGVHSPPPLTLSGSPRLAGFDEKQDTIDLPPTPLAGPKMLRTKTPYMNPLETRRVSSVRDAGILATTEQLQQTVQEFRHIHITKESTTTQEIEQVKQMVEEALNLRNKYVYREPTPSRAQCDVNSEPEFVSPDVKDCPAKSDHGFRMGDNGVMVCWSGTESAETIFHVPSVDQFWSDIATLMDVISSGPCKTFAYNRLKIIEARFKLHLLLNEHLEIAQQKAVPHRDFYNVRKIDNHVHHSACMNQKHLLRFIKHKLKSTPDEIVCQKNGQPMTLIQVFEELKITAYDLSVNMLDTRADKRTFHRFDRFNMKYNPIGEARLREIFLKFNNHINGQYLAEVTHQVFDDLEANKYQFAEFRLSIYGKEKSEWKFLAKWVVDNKLFSKNVRWMIQIPRLYAAYKSNNFIHCFQDMIDSIFVPLFEVSIDPTVDPNLHAFLKTCVGFDSVDDESVRENSHLHERLPLPREWDITVNPPYAMWSYYLYANLYVLNRLRQSKGLTTFAYRPHAGEAGDIEHLAASFLVAKSINHGLVLNESPALQYLFYLSQVGLSMSPLSNNLLFVEYDKNPFFRFFIRGLNVTLSTDDPLMIHVTKEPLVEEYSVAAQVWKLTPVDMCEIARNSVVQCGFEPSFKAHWIGKYYYRHDEAANDPSKTNVPGIRFAFRVELLKEELEYIHNREQNQRMLL